MHGNSLVPARGKGMYREGCSRRVTSARAGAEIMLKAVSEARLTDCICRDPNRAQAIRYSVTMKIRPILRTSDDIRPSRLNPET